MEIDESVVEELDEQSFSSSPKSSDSSSSNRVKFLYSYGGRILPRPADGKLRYVGGQTRVFAADRNITFAELVTKMTEILGSSVALKFQLPTEDLDALVSIKSDEDLKNLLEEYERLEVKVRAFLFPLNPNAAVRGTATHMDQSSEERTGTKAIPMARVSQEAPGSARFCALTKTHISQVRDHRFESHCRQVSARGLYHSQQGVHETAIMAGRPPRLPYNSPVRYALRCPAQIYDPAAMPPQHNSAATVAPMAYVDDSQFLRVDHLVYSGFNCHYTSPAPHFHSAQVPVPGKAKIAPPQYKETIAYKNILHNPYQGDGLEGFRAHHQLLVQH
ncbi:hypothetical protein SUGI_0645810 [Cryptomeria japonica]|nr:hypothetical protein SUGI_0645810 [Cryptomeria japonica]